MVPLTLVSSYLLRVPPDIQKSEMPEHFVEDETEEKTEEQEEYILCRQCRNIIVSPDDRIIVQGSHRHTYANPHGIVFEIGCFKNVKGCGHAGPPSEDFSWFAGFSWRIAVCLTCLTHLGWLFTAPGREGFHGLILDRLIP